MQVVKKTMMAHPTFPSQRFINLTTEKIKYRGLLGFPLNNVFFTRHSRLKKHAVEWYARENFLWWEKPVSRERLWILEFSMWLSISINPTTLQTIFINLFTFNIALMMTPQENFSHERKSKGERGGSKTLLKNSSISSNKHKHSCNWQPVVFGGSVENRLSNTQPPNGAAKKIGKFYFLVFCSLPRY